MPRSNDSTGSFSAGGQDADRDQGSFEIEFYGHVLRRNPYHIDALRRQVELLAARGRHAEALPLDRRLVELCPQDCVVCYNLACSLAMAGQIGEGIESLRRALELGYDDFAHMAADSDLDPLRHRPEFRRLMARLISRRRLRS